MAERSRFLVGCIVAELARVSFARHSTIVVDLRSAVEISGLRQFLVADTDAVDARFVCPFGFEYGLSIPRN